MADYTNLNCPVCGEQFKEDDDIVVCPICGTPHHRECFKKEGKCANQSWHSEGKTFDADKEMAEKRSAEGEKAEQKPPVTCPRCGYENPADAVFCNKCGIPLSQGIPNGEGGAKGFTFSVGFNPFIPKPDEKIDGVEAWKLSAVVKENVPKFLMQFKSMYQSGKKISFNFCAMLFGWAYFLYRKMYALAAAIFVINMFLAIPSALYMALNGQSVDMTSILTALGITMAAEEIAAINTSINASFLSIVNITSLLSTAFSVVCALFANWLYFIKCKKTVAKIEAETADTEQFKQKASKKGGVNRILIIALLVSYAALVWIVTGLAAVPK